MNQHAYFVPSAASNRIAGIINFFRTTHLDTAAFDTAHTLLDGIMLAHSSGPRGSFPGISLFEPSNVGKTSMVKQYILKRVVPRLQAERPEFTNAARESVAELQREILHVELTDDATPTTIASDIVAKLGGRITGSRAALWKQAYTLLENSSVKLLIIDEIQHIASRGKVVTADGVIDKIDLRLNRSAGDALKTIMNRGTVPVLFCGTRVCTSLLNGTQFRSRAWHKIELPPLDWTKEGDKAEFRRFLGNLIIAIGESGLIERPKLLLSGQTPIRLSVASSGRLGILCRLVQHAMLEYARSDRREMIEDDLVNAVDYLVAMGECEVNPFRAGRAKLELING